MYFRTSTRLLTAAALVALTALAACGGDDSGDPAAATTAPESTAVSDTTAAPDTTAGEVPAGELPDKIRIAYQQVPNGDLVVKNLGYLEEAFGPDVDIEWNLFASGGDVNQAVLAGSVDIGLVGSSPASRGLSSGIEYRVPWIFDVIGDAEALVAKEGIATIADLKGKTVATPFASTGHFSLLAALAGAGLSESDVNIIDAEPDAIYAGWVAGQIDAAYVWNPNLAKLKEEGGTVLVSSAELAAEGKTTYDLAVVTNDFADSYPAAVELWIAQQDKAVKLIAEDLAAAADAVAIELNVTPEEAADQLGDLVFLDAAEQISAENLGGGLATNLFAAAQFNLEQGQIESVQDEAAYAAGVDATFAHAVAS